MSNAYEAGFTPGMIGAAGRLACTSDHPCRPGKSFSLNGVSINNDVFGDFVTNPSLLTADTFFNLDTYLDTAVEPLSGDLQQPPLHVGRRRLDGRRGLGRPGR